MSVSVFEMFQSEIIKYATIILNVMNSSNFLPLTIIMYAHKCIFQYIHRQSLRNKPVVCKNQQKLIFQKF